MNGHRNPYVEVINFDMQFSTIKKHFDNYPFQKNQDFNHKIKSSLENTNIIKFD